MTDTETTATTDDSKLLDVYLRDHLAGAHAGLALAERCRRSDDGTPPAVLLDEHTTEIAADRDTLEQIMDRLDVREHTLKTIAAGRS